MATYKVNLTEQEYKILSYYHDPEYWVTGLFKHRARVAIEEMFKEELQIAVQTGKSVPADKEAAILSSTQPAMADREVPSGPADAAAPNS